MGRKGLGDYVKLIFNNSFSGLFERERERERGVLEETKERDGERKVGTHPPPIRTQSYRNQTHHRSIFLHLTLTQLSNPPLRSSEEPILPSLFPPKSSTTIPSITN